MNCEVCCIESADGEQFCHLMTPENLQNRHVRFLDVPPVWTFHNLYICIILLVWLELKEPSSRKVTNLCSNHPNCNIIDFFFGQSLVYDIGIFCRHLHNLENTGELICVRSCHWSHKPVLTFVLIFFLLVIHPL